MANYSLFLSSTIYSSIIIITMFLCFEGLYIYPAPYLVFTLSIAMSTSIWNHYSTCNYAKWSDRIVIAIASWCDLYYIYAAPMNMYYSEDFHFITSYTCFILISISMCSYFIGRHRIHSSPALYYADKGIHFAETIFPPFNAKKCQVKRNYPHLICHTLGTMMHCLLIYKYYLAAVYPLLNYTT